MKFGYQMIKGQTVVNSVQVAVFLKAMSDYIIGTSLKQKAEELTEQKVEYAPGKSEWNKSRVQRMLTDTAYLGTEQYPAIVDKETFDKVQEIMKSRNTQKNLNRQEVFSSTIIPIKCGKCGCDTVRRYEPRTKVPKIMHTCTNPECKSQYRITDDELREKIKIGMTQATEKELRPSEETMQTIRRLDNEIERDLQCLDIDGETLKNKILECAALKYSLCTRKRESMDYSKINPFSQIFIKEIKRRVSAVYLDSNTEIWLKMTDGQIIGKDVDEHDSNSSS